MPKEILEEYCKKNNVPGPFFYGSTKLTMDGKMYNLADFGKISTTPVNSQCIVLVNSENTKFP